VQGQGLIVGPKKESATTMKDYKQRKNTLTKEPEAWQNMTTLTEAQRLSLSLNSK
jgi:hypothetical protein